MNDWFHMKQLMFAIISSVNKTFSYTFLLRVHTNLENKQLNMLGMAM